MSEPKIYTLELTEMEMVLLRWMVSKGYIKCLELIEKAKKPGPDDEVLLERLEACVQKIMEEATREPEWKAKKREEDLIALKSIVAAVASKAHDDFEKNKHLLRQHKIIW
jgi:hypothetical protein